MKFSYENMYEETGCSDPNSMSAEPTPDASENGFPQTMAHIASLPSFPPPLIPGAPQETTHGHFHDNDLNLSMDEVSYHHHRTSGGDAMELEFQQAAAAAVGAFDNTHNFGQEVTSDSNRMVCLDQSNWVGTQIQEMGFNHHHQIQSQDHQHQQHHFSDSAMATAYTQAPDLLNFLNMPAAARCSNKSSISFSNLHTSAMGGYLGDLPAGDGGTSSSTSLSILYDPLFHLNLPPQPPLFKELFHSLPHGYGLPAASSRVRGGSLFPEGEIMEREGTAGVYEDGDGSGVLEFSRDMADCIGKGRDGKMTKHYATERHRRVQLNDKYVALRSLIPIPTKTDRASIVGDAINYIQELLREVKELKQLVEKKRCSRERSKRVRTAEELEGGGAWDVESSNAKAGGVVGDGVEDQSYNLRSSWLQRKTKDTEVDVRIVDDEVTIKLVQRKLNCLLLVSRLLDDLQLDLHHVAGGHIGDYYSFLFNTKIYEGSSMYASAIANKVMEAVDRQYNNTSIPINLLVFFFFCCD
ncbi:transcription factor bHLH91-like isoform X2 [Benincasa hispida]|uniref:transcription factor bHLH91-like isoform X2 n=1 Tax=Benincasa hispida TaxID=102211 RepID=UPI001901B017|nr:transcription factor bHLH91-like isoform X2 [Benincasa hispida]